MNDSVVSLALPMVRLRKAACFAANARACCSSPRGSSDHSAWAFTDIDACPTKSFIIENYKDPAIRPFFDLAHAKRPRVELFDVRKDADCLHNLAGKPAFARVERELRETLMAELRASKDPRVVGPDREVFDSYIRYSPMREFPKPD